MKLLISVIALLAVAYCDEEGEPNGPIEGTAVDPAGAAHHKGSHMPPVIQKAIDGFSETGKKALEDIHNVAKTARQNGEAFTPEQFFSQLKTASPDDAAKLEAAQKELEDLVSKLPQADRDLYALAKKAHASGKPEPADIQNFAKALNALSDSDR
uniref:DUF148 domain-containing protein n=1 Tax=Steinernema glaseri TaxID=37863 RepID=A0A1I8ATV4_9BILA